MAINLTAANFEDELKKATLPLLVDFFADWCGPCKMLAPILDQIGEEYKGKLAIGKLDVDANPQTAAKFGVMSIPTVIFFKNGQPVKQLVGYQGREALVKGIEEASSSH